MSPAGDFDAMRAAVANGADAVYFGLDNFNARHRAANFTLEQLPEIMQYLHGHNVKGFLTFNTLIFSDELSEAVDYIRQIAAAGVDAVIVQDLGLARLIHTMAPGLAIHGSTQMTLTEPRGIEFVRQFGVSRVVLARELSLDDIRRIKSQTTMDLEVFIHGALCVAYSGQCLTSEALGGRSANRGQCAQACRLPYDLIVDGAVRDLGDKSYLLSPQDLAAYDLVGDLSKLGIACLKIEGRLKSAHYVAATTQTYRSALDAASSDRRFNIGAQQRADLEQTFSRGFTHGFLSGVNHQELVAARFPKSRGVRIGTVEKVLPRSLIIETESHVLLKSGDGVVFDEGHPEQDEQGGRVFSVKPRSRRLVEIELGRGDVNLSAISAGAIVWKTDDPALRKRLEHSFSRDTVVRRLRLSVQVRANVGECLSIVFRQAEHRVEVSWDKPLEAAQKFPLSESMLREQLGRLGDTPYELGELNVDTSGSPMVPKSVLNDLRRQAVAELIQIRSRRYCSTLESPHALEQLRARPPLPPGEGGGEGRRTVVPSTLANCASDDSSTAGPHPALSRRERVTDRASLHVLTRTLDQLRAVLDWQRDLQAMVYCDFEDIRRYKDAVAMAQATSTPIALATLRIVKPHEHGLLQQILDCNPDAVLVRNLAAVSFCQDVAPRLPLIGDYSLNIANELTAGIFADAGLTRIVPSYDLNWRQLSAMLARFDPSRFECVIHQHMPMFHMEHCVFAHTLSNGKDFRGCGRPCEKHQVDLRDRVGQPHPLIPDVGCRNTVFNAQAQSAAEYVPRMLDLGICHFRVELLREKPHEVAPLLDRYADLVTRRAEPHSALRSLRVLNQLGVTRGTLDRE
jgi:putative protease